MTMAEVSKKGVVSHPSVHLLFKSRSGGGDRYSLHFFQGSFCSRASATDVQVYPPYRPYRILLIRVTKALNVW